MDISAKARLNLERARILLLDNPLGIDILVRILSGAGAKTFYRCNSSDEAKAVTAENPVDLIVADVQAGGEGQDGCDFVHWLRRSGLTPNAFAPVTLASAHTSMANVGRARDCGANFVVLKPLSPGILLERIVWVGRDSRPFVDAGTYVGPDRRFKNGGLSPDMDGRRAGDLKGNIGVATDPNLSQSEIDDFMKPMRVAG
ncbi:MAG: response regulator [Phenylobacterium sp.]